MPAHKWTLVALALIAVAAASPASSQNAPPAPKEQTAPSCKLKVQRCIAECVRAGVNPIRTCRVYCRPELMCDYSLFNLTRE